MKKIFFVIIIIFIVLGISTYIFLNKSDDIFREKSKKVEEIEELKDNIGATGESEIYEVQKDNYTNSNVLIVKSDIKYKVAFAGLIKKSLPNINEIDEILNSKYPLKNGIWIEKDSRKKVIELLNNDHFFNSKYKIDDEGYLQIEQKNNSNEKDEILSNILNSEKQYIIDISSICYIVDEITGKILEYSFESLDKYQIYEYFEEENKKIIFITENKEKQLKEEEIVNSILNLLKI